MRHALPAALLALVALGCAITHPKATKAERDAALSFPPPPAGMARVYVFRAGTPPFGGCLYETDGMRVRLGMSAFTYFDLEPGSYEIAAHCMATRLHVQLSVEAGELYYVDSTFEFQLALVVVDERRGQSTLLKRDALALPVPKEDFWITGEDGPRPERR